MYNRPYENLLGYQQDSVDNAVAAMIESVKNDYLNPSMSDPLEAVVDAVTKWLYPNAT